MKCSGSDRTRSSRRRGSARGQAGAGADLQDAALGTREQRAAPLAHAAVLAECEERVVEGGANAAPGRLACGHDDEVESVAGLVAGRFMVRQCTTPASARHRPRWAIRRAMACSGSAPRACRRARARGVRGGGRSSTADRLGRVRDVPVHRRGPRSGVRSPDAEAVRDEPQHLDLARAEQPVVGRAGRAPRGPPARGRRGTRDGGQHASASPGQGGDAPSRATRRARAAARRARLHAKGSRGPRGGAARARVRGRERRGLARRRGRRPRAARPPSPVWPRRSQARERAPVSASALGIHVREHPRSGPPMRPDRRQRASRSGAGAIASPWAYAPKTKRAHRFGWRAAKATAVAPPPENPSRDSSSTPSAPTSASTVRRPASRSALARPGRSESPVPGGRAGPPCVGGRARR